MKRRTKVMGLIAAFCVVAAAGLLACFALSDGPLERWPSALVLNAGSEHHAAAPMGVHTRDGRYVLVHIARAEEPDELYCIDMKEARIHYWPVDYVRRFALGSAWVVGDKVRDDPGLLLAKPSESEFDPKLHIESDAFDRRHPLNIQFQSFEGSGEIELELGGDLAKSATVSSGHAEGGA